MINLSPLQRVTLRHVRDHAGRTATSIAYHTASKLALTIKRMIRLVDLDLVVWNGSGYDLTDKGAFYCRHYKL